MCKQRGTGRGRANPNRGQPESGPTRLELKFSEVTSRVTRLEMRALGLMIQNCECVRLMISDVKEITNPKITLGSRLNPPHNTISVLLSRD